ncbi:MAG: VWA domain-containing protein [Acidobacteriota bacterium]
MISRGPRRRPIGQGLGGLFPAGAALLGLFLLTLPAWGQPPPGADAEAPVHIEWKSPNLRDALFGQVALEVALSPTGDRLAVSFLLDGRRLGEVHAPPYRIVVDVGEENRDRTVKVVARNRRGQVAALEHTFEALRIDDGLDLHLQPLYVSVTERNGLRVLDLDMSDFTVSDNGVPQDLVTFESGDLPLAAAVLVDGSLSMRGERLENARRGVHAFARGLNPLDEATVMVFTDVVARLEVLDPEGDVSDVLQDLGAAGGTAINDHLYLAMQHLESRLGRRVVILLSDGRDNHSLLHSREVLEVARESQAMIYWLLLGETTSGGLLQRGERVQERIGKYEHPTSAWRTRRKAVAELDGLKRLVKESGGRILPIPSDRHIQPAFEDILAELREQYALGFYPSQRRGDGAWRQVTVSVNRRDLKVRHRQGYYDR